jgi:hypothetical protein
LNRLGFTEAIITKLPVLLQPQVITMTRQRLHIASLWGWACLHMPPPSTIIIIPFIKQDLLRTHLTTHLSQRLASYIRQRQIP